MYTEIWEVGPSGHLCKVVDRGVRPLEPVSRRGPKMGRLERVGGVVGDLTSKSTKVLPERDLLSRGVDFFRNLREGNQWTDNGQSQTSGDLPEKGGRGRTDAS